MVAVDLVDCAAARPGCDAEECIQKALKDGEIETCQPSGGRRRGYDAYRLTARGRREASEHLRCVFRESAGGVGGAAAGREYEEGKGADGRAPGPPFRSGPRRRAAAGSGRQF